MTEREFELAIEQLKEDREAEKSYVRADIIDTIAEIIENLDDVKSLMFLQRIQKNLHNIEDEIHLISDDCIWDGEKWITQKEYREVSRYGEW